MFSNKIRATKLTCEFSHVFASLIFSVLASAEQKSSQKNMSAGWTPVPKRSSAGFPWFPPRSDPLPSLCASEIRHSRCTGSECRDRTPQIQSVSKITGCRTSIKPPSVRPVSRLTFCWRGQTGDVDILKHEWLSLSLSYSTSNRGSCGLVKAFISKLVMFLFTDCFSGNRTNPRHTWGTLWTIIMLHNTIYYKMELQSIITLPSVKNRSTT